MATRQQVINRAANDLGLLRLGQALSANDGNRMAAAYDEVYAELKNEALATWTSTGNVPDELVPHLALLVADNAVNTYGVSNDRLVRIRGVEGERPALAMREIRKLVTPAYVSVGEPTDF